MNFNKGLLFCESPCLGLLEEPGLKVYDLLTKLSSLLLVLELVERRNKVLKSTKKDSLSTKAFVGFISKKNR